MTDHTFQPEAHNPSFVIAPMKRRHLKAVMRIERLVYPTPWSQTLFMSEMSLRTNRSYLVAQYGSIVVGYSGLMFADIDAHVTNIAVDPTWQQNQIATRLMLSHARLAIANKAKHMTLEVRLSNRVAQRLYAKFGFAPAGIRKNYYQEENEDALIMWVNNIGSPEFAKRLAAIEAGIRGTTSIDIDPHRDQPVETSQ